MIYRIVHRTTYRYKYPVSLGNHVACLKPRVPAAPPVGAERAVNPTAPGDPHRARGFFRKPSLLFYHSGAASGVGGGGAKRGDHVGDAPPWPPQPLPWEEAARSIANDHSPEGLKPTSSALSRRASGCAGVRRLCAPVVYTGTALGGGASRSDGAHPQRFSLRFEGDERPHPHRRSLPETARRMPGLLALANRLPALPESPCTLCEWISSNLSASGEAEAGGRRCIACLGVGLLSRNRLA